MLQHYNNTMYILFGVNKGLYSCMRTMVNIANNILRYTSLGSDDAMQKELQMNKWDLILSYPIDIRSSKVWLPCRPSKISNILQMFSRLRLKGEYT